MEENSVSSRQLKLIAELFTELPEDFSERYQAAQQIRDAFRRAMAISLQDSLNAHLSRQPQSTGEERRKLAAEVNDCLRHLSLAIRCPRTGSPAILIVDTVNGERSDTTRFRLEVKCQQGKRTRTIAATQLPLPLELMPSPARLEGFARYYKPRSSSNER